MSEFVEYLQQRFPELQPQVGAPSLHTINGIGTMVYGHRDHDDETQTYVKTLFFTILFIPIFALRAYRVADAQQGWYFFGRVPLSSASRALNYLVLLGLVGGGGTFYWEHHVNTPEYRAARRLDETNRLADANDLQGAVLGYREIADTAPPEQSAQALRQLGLLLDTKMPGAPAEVAATGLDKAVDLHRLGRRLDRLYERGEALARGHAEKDPRAALKLIDIVAPLATDPQALTAFRLPLLERLLAEAPDDPGPASELAVILEQRKELKRCEEMLTPHAARLGEREGARILGQIYVGRGKLDEAYPLLTAYAEHRLKRYQEVEQRWIDVRKQVDDEIINRLRTGAASDFDYVQYRTADKQTQNKLVNDYVERRLRDDPRYKTALDDIRRDSRVVDVALDLGMVQLQRAQAVKDADARRRELEAAEKTFLAVRGAAGQSVEFRLNLGQVYYWLGKQQEGRKLFDEHLGAAQRSAQALQQVALVLRQVGAAAEAKSMAEEAYAAETDALKKGALASFRAAMALEVDDRILWLGRANQENPQVRASLASARGQQAHREGRDAEAAEQFRQAIAGYEQAPEDAAALNNCALVYFDLFRATGAADAQAKGVALLEKALPLRPDDTVLLHNTADQLLATSLGALVRDRIDLTLLRAGGGLDLLEFLYRDEAGWDELAARVHADRGVAKAVSYYERLLLLAPRDAQTYTTLASLYLATRARAPLEALARRSETATFDLDDYRKHRREFLEGKDDVKNRQEIERSLERTRKELPAARAAGGATFAVAVMREILLQVAADMIGLPAPAESLVALAEEAERVAPSQGTHRLLLNSLLHRAHQDLIKSDPAYKQVADRCARALSSSYVIAIVLAGEGPARRACVAHADVKRALEMLVEEGKRFPKRAGEWSWAMLRTTYPSEAAKVAAAHQADDLTALEGALHQRTAPLGSDQAYRQAWGLMMTGRATEATAALQRAAAAGVVLTEDTKE
jgi:tetratricopeptide (TPR) repeat protein